MSGTWIGGGSLNRSVTFSADVPAVTAGQTTMGTVPPNPCPLDIVHWVRSPTKTLPVILQ